MVLHFTYSNCYYGDIVSTGAASQVDHCALVAMETVTTSYYNIPATVCNIWNNKIDKKLLYYVKSIVLRASHDLISNVAIAPSGKSQ